MTIEEELENLYTQLFYVFDGFSDMSLEQWKTEVKQSIKGCKEQGEKEGTADLPNNYGTLILISAKQGEPSAQKIVNNARSDGAKDEDIVEWWNLHDLQRRMVLWSELFFRYSSFLSFKEDGLSSELAMAKNRKIFPMYGNPDEEKHVSGDDRPLPQEIRGRVDKYREKHGASNIKDKVEEFTTYNAFIRDEIRKSKL